MCFLFFCQHICLGVSIGMLYAFLSSFFWMLVEGIHVYLMVVKVFKGSRKMKVYMIIGWCKLQLRVFLVLVYFRILCMIVVLHLYTTFLFYSRFSSSNRRHSWCQIPSTICPSELLLDIYWPFPYMDIRRACAFCIGSKHDGVDRNSEYITKDVS